VRVPQTRARNICPGLTAEVTIPEMPGQVFKANVVTTSEAMSATSRTLLTELKLDSSENQILPGSYAQLRFTGAQAAPALTLPSNALLFCAAGLEVGVVQPDGTVELRKVQVGRDFGKTVEVLAGVNASDRVIANPSDSLVSGATVRVADATEFQAARQSHTMSLTGGQYTQATIAR
jgi:membrane fusion protein, multidrug efflux system